MIIPPGSIAPDTLRAIVEEYITREGTDYGEQEMTLDEKVETLMPQVRNQEVLVVFDDELQTVNLVHKNDVG